MFIAVGLLQNCQLSIFSTGVRPRSCLVNIMEFDSSIFQDALTQTTAGLGITLTGDQLEQFTCYARELVTWNKSVNLTAITEPREIAVKHMADSLAALPYIGVGIKSAQVLDIGSGGGFPAIPFAIMNHELQIVSVDSVRKKISFQTQVAAQLRLTNLRAVHSRVQEMDKVLGYLPVFDCVISRAFANLTMFYELALPWLKPNGRIVSYKSAVLDEEQAGLLTKYSHLKISRYSYDLPGADARYIVVLENCGAGK